MSNHLIRTFISVTVPKEVISLKEMVMTTVTFKGKNLKWVRTGQLHLTLKFIGYTPPDSIEEINSTLDNIVKRHDPINLSVNGTGCFPVPERPRVLWLGIKDETDRMENLVMDINTSLDKLGFPIEEKEFTPHITIGRVIYPPKNTPDLNLFLKTKFNPVTMSIARIRFISSELFPNGSIYSILGTHFLTPKGEKE